jgi:hypothetical protein
MKTVVDTLSHSSNMSLVPKKVIGLCERHTTHFIQLYNTLKCINITLHLNPHPIWTMYNVAPRVTSPSGGSRGPFVGYCYMYYRVPADGMWKPLWVITLAI